MVSSVIYLLKRVAIGIVLRRRQFGTSTCCMWKNNTAVLLSLTHLLLTGLSNPCVDVRFVSNLRKRGKVASFGFRVFKLKIEICT